MKALTDKVAIVTGASSGIGIDRRPLRGDREAIRYATGKCSLGTVLVAQSERGICAILLGNDADALACDLRNRFAQAELGDRDVELERLVSQVGSFIESPAVGLNVPLDVRGAAFERRVWNALRAIPAGSTATYADIAERVGAAGQAYAVGEACAANIIAVAIPCHRVVRKDGSLAGYRWGFWRKRVLLRREGARIALRARSQRSAGVQFLLPLGEGEGGGAVRQRRTA